MMGHKLDLFRAAMRASLLLGCAASLTAAPAPGAAGLMWLTSYAGRSTNSAVHDRRFDTLLNRAVPRVRLYLGLTKSHARQPLEEAVRKLLEGRPELVAVRQERYVILSACRAPSCAEKSFLWVDTEVGLVIGAVVHYYFQDLRSTHRPLLLVFSNQIDSGNMPESFRYDLNNWLTAHKLAIAAHRFVGSAGVVAHY